MKNAPTLKERVAIYQENLQKEGIPITIVANDKVAYLDEPKYYVSVRILSQKLQEIKRVLAFIGADVSFIKTEEDSLFLLADYDNQIDNQPTAQLVVNGSKEDCIKEKGLQKAREELQKWFEGVCAEIESMKTLTSFEELQEDEKAWVLETIPQRPHWNKYLQKKILEKLQENLEKKEGLAKSVIRKVSVDRYSFMPACSFGGEIPVRIAIQLFATRKEDKENILTLLYEGWGNRLQMVDVQHIRFIAVNIYGDNAVVEIDCDDESKAFPCEEVTLEQFQNDLAMYFAGVAGSEETQLTLFSKSLREEDALKKYIEENNIRFDENLALFFSF